MADSPCIHGGEVCEICAKIEALRRIRADVCETIDAEIEKLQAECG